MTDGAFDLYEVSSVGGDSAVYYNDSTVLDIMNPGWNSRGHIEVTSAERILGTRAR